eukprot:364580-Chlamydomonas_euryale.AAC.2
MIGDYLAAARYGYSLAVYHEEAGLGDSERMSDADVLDVLHVPRGSLLHTGVEAAKAEAAYARKGGQVQHGVSGLHGASQHAAWSHDRGPHGAAAVVRMGRIRRPHRATQMGRMGLSSRDAWDRVRGPRGDAEEKAHAAMEEKMAAWDRVRGPHGYTEEKALVAVKEKVHGPCQGAASGRKCGMREAVRGLLGAMLEGGPYGATEEKAHGPCRRTAWACVMDRCHRVERGCRSGAQAREKGRLPPKRSARLRSLRSRAAFATTLRAKLPSHTCQAGAPQPQERTQPAGQTVFNPQP